MSDTKTETKPTRKGTPPMQMQQPRDSDSYQTMGMPQQHGSPVGK